MDICFVKPNLSNARNRNYNKVLSWNGSLVAVGGPHAVLSSRFMIRIVPEPRFRMTGLTKQVSMYKYVKKTLGWSYSFKNSFFVPLQDLDDIHHSSNNHGMQDVHFQSGREIHSQFQEPIAVESIEKHQR